MTAITERLVLLSQKAAGKNMLWAGILGDSFSAGGSWNGAPWGCR